MGSQHNKNGGIMEQEETEINKVVYIHAPQEKADVKQGFTMLANSFVEALSQCDLTGRQFQVMLAIIRKTYGWGGKKYDWITASNIAQSK